MSSKSRRPRVAALALGLVMLMSMVVGISVATAETFPAEVTKPIGTFKPELVGHHWVAITGSVLGSTAGAMTFIKGGNAVDAACAMLAVVCVQNQSLSWGGETQALVYDPNRHKVFGINGCGVAPTGATPEFFIDQGLAYPPGSGPQAAITPGTPGGLMLMAAEFGRLSLAEILEPAISMADGYTMDYSKAANYAGESRDEIFGTPGTPGTWKYSGPIFRPGGIAPKPGEVFVQRDLATTFRKLVAAEKEALAAGKSRKEAIMAANDRFYRGDIAVEFARGSQEGGGTHTYEDLANWYPRIEEPRITTYKGIEVYKLQEWTQGPVLLQTLNILEGIDLQSMGHNSTEYIHALYQAMDLAYADRDFYYGDPYFPPDEPMEGLLSKEYAAERRKLIDPTKHRGEIGPGDPYPYQGEENPYLDMAKARWGIKIGTTATAALPSDEWDEKTDTTSVQAADMDGWVCSITPSGGWPAAYIAGHTGVGMSQRMQSFVLDPAMNPFNVLEPGKIPRVTLTPSLALIDGHPFMSFSLPSGDGQDQALLQLFLNVAEFGMTMQAACEAPKFRSYHMESSFGTHAAQNGRIRMDGRIPQEVADELTAMGYDVDRRTTGGAGDLGTYTYSLTGIRFNWEEQTLEGGAVIGSRYGISW